MSTKDPFWAALEKCKIAISEDPGHVLFDWSPDYEEGLNATAVNELASQAGLSQPFKVWTDDDARWLEVNHPDGSPPVRWRRWHRVLPTRHWTPAKLDRTVAYLLAWQEVAIMSKRGNVKTTSPSWAHRDEPANLNELLQWLRRVARPHLDIIAPDRCVVSHSANTGVPLTIGPSKADLAKHAELLWDETSRACDWLADHGYSDAPTRQAKTADADRAHSQYRTVEQYISLRMQAHKGGDKPKRRGGKTPSPGIIRRNKRIVVDFAKGLDTNAVTEKHGVSAAVARKVKSDGYRAIRAAVANGVSVDEIAADYKMAAELVQKILDEGKNTLPENRQS